MTEANYLGGMMLVASGTGSEISTSIAAVKGDPTGFGTPTDMDEIDDTTDTSDNNDLNDIVVDSSGKRILFLDRQTEGNGSCCGCWGGGRDIQAEAFQRLLNRYGHLRLVPPKVRIYFWSAADLLYSAMVSDRIHVPRDPIQVAGLIEEVFRQRRQQEGMEDAIDDGEYDDDDSTARHQVLPPLQVLLQQSHVSTKSQATTTAKNIHHSNARTTGAFERYATEKKGQQIVEVRAPDGAFVLIEDTGNDDGVSYIDPRRRLSGRVSELRSVRRMLRAPSSSLESQKSATPLIISTEESLGPSPSPPEGTKFTQSPSHQTTRYRSKWSTSGEGSSSGVGSSIHRGTSSKWSTSRVGSSRAGTSEVWTSPDAIAAASGTSTPSIKSRSSTATAAAAARSRGARTAGSSSTTGKISRRQKRSLPRAASSSESSRSPTGTNSVSSLETLPQRRSQTASRVLLDKSSDNTLSTRHAAKHLTAHPKISKATTGVPPTKKRRGATTESVSSPSVGRVSSQVSVSSTASLFSAASGHLPAAAAAAPAGGIPKGSKPPPPAAAARQQLKGPTAAAGGGGSIASTPRVAQRKELSAGGGAKGATTSKLLARPVTKKDGQESSNPSSPAGSRRSVIASSRPAAAAARRSTAAASDIAPPARTAKALLATKRRVTATAESVADGSSTAVGTAKGTRSKTQQTKPKSKAASAARDS